MAILVGMTLASYAPVRQADYVDFDDADYVHGNHHVASGLNLENVHWSLVAYHAANWHPLTWMSHMVERPAIRTQPPRSPRCQRRVFHAANAAVLFLLLVSMTGRAWPSFLAAGIFALHPLNVESVAWIAEQVNAQHILRPAGNRLLRSLCAGTTGEPTWAASGCSDCRSCASRCW